MTHHQIAPPPGQSRNPFLGGHFGGAQSAPANDYTAAYAAALAAAQAAGYPFGPPPPSHGPPQPPHPPHGPPTANTHDPIAMFSAFNVIASII